MSFLLRDHANLLCIFKRLINVSVRRLDKTTVILKIYKLFLVWTRTTDRRNNRREYRYEEYVTYSYISSGAFVIQSTCLILLKTRTKREGGTAVRIRGGCHIASRKSAAYPAYIPLYIPPMRVMSRFYFLSLDESSLDEKKKKRYKEDFKNLLLQYICLFLTYYACPHLSRGVVFVGCRL